MESAGSSLLALMLVGKSSRGSSIIYSYPPSPTAVTRTSKPIYPSHRTHHRTRSNSDSSESSSSTDSSDSLASTSDDLNGGEGAEEAKETYLGFPSSVLASLLCPKRELCDQPFELVVDHLAFVGHPVWLGDDNEAMGQSRPEVVEEEDDEDEEDTRGRRRERSEAGDALAPSHPSSRDSTLHPTERSHSQPAPTTTATLSRSRSPNPNSIAFQRSPSATPTLSTHHQSSATSSHQSFLSSGRLISFNFLCVIDTPPDSHLSSHLEGYYKDVVVPLTVNVKALERKGLWLGKEAGKIRKMKERWNEKGIPQIEQTSLLPSSSSLAAALSQLYTSLKSSSLANITLASLPIQVLLRGELTVEDDYENDTDDLVLPLPLAEEGEVKATVEDEKERSVSPVPVEGGTGGRSRPPPLFSKMRKRALVKYEPWETLLLFEEPDELKKAVMMEGSLLERFLEMCSPTLSFHEYDILLDADEHELRESVNHLIHWKKGRIIDTISMKNTYVVSSRFDVTTLPTLIPKFRLAHPTLPPLPVLLSQLHTQEPFDSLVPLPSLRPVYLNALKWLLQNDLVDKLHSFVRIVISEEVKANSSMHWGRLRGREREDSSGVTDGSTSAGMSGGGGGGIYRKTSRPDLDDARGMTIVGSVLSNSPPLSRSAHSARSSGKRSAIGKRGSLTGQPLSATTYSSVEENNGEEEKGPSVILEPGRPTALESRWLWEIAREKEKGVVDKFERMIRMLNGAHHLDEIRYRAHLSRKDVRLVLSAFSDHLIIFSHP